MDIDEGIDRPVKPKSIERYVYDPNDMPVVKYHLEQYLIRISRHLRGLNWQGIVKLHQIVRFFNVLKGKKLENEWMRFGHKLFNFTISKVQAASLINLSSDELISMLEIVESLKVNKPELIKQLLVCTFFLKCSALRPFGDLFCLGVAEVESLSGDLRATMRRLPHPFQEHRGKEEVHLQL